MSHNEATTDAAMGTVTQAVTIARKVLGDLSTNAQRTPKASSALDQKKSTTGSPLKRSFAAAINDDGLTYMKRRRLSYTTPAVTILRPQEAEEEDAQSIGHSSDRESSTERHSFSSLINYDPSSQNGASSQAALKAPSTDETQVSLQSEDLSQAELLRMRLQIAMYKVRTKQTAVSFDYLREDTPSGSRESSKAVQEAVEQLRHEAHARLRDERTTHLSMTSVPALPPTAMQTILSPERRLADQSHDIAVTPKVRMLRGSPATARTSLLGTDLTSSAVKGQVAEGLLGLKNGF